MKKICFIFLLFSVCLFAKASFQEKMHSCQSGNFKLCYQIANELLVGEHGYGREMDAFTLYEKTCNIGCTDSCVALGLFYGDRLQNMEDNYKKSLFYLEKGCSMSSAFGCLVLSEEYKKSGNLDKAKKNTKINVFNNEISACVL